MIYKSYLVEQNINILKKDVVLIYGENDGLKGDLKKKIKIKQQQYKYQKYHSGRNFKESKYFF
jgi:hypothetical protein